MSKFAIKANALGDGDLTLEIPEMAVDQTLEFPPEGGRLARADAADGMPLMSDGTPVVESGSNSDGDWVRWADGTQLVRKRVLGAGTGDRTATLPAPFVDTGYAATLQEIKGSGASSGATFAYQVSLSTASVLAFNTDPGNLSTSDVGYTAIGRWK